MKKAFGTSNKGNFGRSDAKKRSQFSELGKGNPYARCSEIQQTEVRSRRSVYPPKSFFDAGGRSEVEG
jgi:hypothetical protein